MASEEIELNHYLAERGIDCIESDMGEYIVQLAGEKPSHIVMPAIHKTKADIATLFEQHIPIRPTRKTSTPDPDRPARAAQAFVRPISACPA
jgi:L-lactate utilization protein LutB